MWHLVSTADLAFNPDLRVAGLCALTVIQSLPSLRDPNTNHMVDPTGSSSSRFIWFLGQVYSQMH